MYPFVGWHTCWSHGFVAVNNAELNVSIQIVCGRSQIPLYMNKHRTAELYSGSYIKENMHIYFHVDKSAYILIKNEWGFPFSIFLTVLRSFVFFR